MLTHPSFRSPRSCRHCGINSTLFIRRCLPSPATRSGVIICPYWQPTDGGEGRKACSPAPSPNAGSGDGLLATAGCAECRSLSFGVGGQAGGAATRVLLEVMNIPLIDERPAATHLLRGCSWTAQIGPAQSSPAVQAFPWRYLWASRKAADRITLSPASTSAAACWTGDSPFLAPSGTNGEEGATGCGSRCFVNARCLYACNCTRERKDWKHRQPLRR